MTNEIESANGAAVFNAYAHDNGAYPYHNQPETLARLLRDLMHYADDWSIDFPPVSRKRDGAMSKIAISRTMKRAIDLSRHQD